MGIISTKSHTIIGLAGGALLLLAPYLFGFNDQPAATAVALFIGIFIILNELITQSPFSPFKIVPMKIHIALDVITGLFLAVSPWLFNFFNEGVQSQWLPHVIVGVFVITYALLTSTADEAKSVRE